MPTLAIVDGVSIRMYAADHPPPHFHAQYSEHSAVIGLNPMVVLMGSLPPNKLKRVLDWAAEHHISLVHAWSLASENQKPGKIDE
ncbi:MAG: DUF4160 domain-containing protein [Roseitalea porphyridii]|uniref:DUF4160 domain-containing protein n=1 Tax=Roseitalea porphyridii TaxID=1852022 RepID=UPI0032D8F655